MKALRDDALFSDSNAARIRSITELAREYGVRSVPIITEIMQTLPKSESGLFMVCTSQIEKINNSSTLKMGRKNRLGLVNLEEPVYTF